VPGRGDAGRDCFWARVAAQVPDAQVVHRLDMATSGLMLFGRGAAMQRALSIAFARREVGKGYIAVVEGIVEHESGEIDAPLAADWPNRPRQRVDFAHGKASTTRWRRLAVEGGRTRLALEPVTGRSHQLRVHLAHIGHPIVGDTLYAPPAVAAAAPRLLLHAARLALRHPGDGRALDFASEAPF
jgi:tRNA pseudouridine32 synthase / 23S rRNA pseudouridine746 synthase